MLEREMEEWFPGEYYFTSLVCIVRACAPGRAMTKRHDGEDKAGRHLVNCWDGGGTEVGRVWGRRANAPGGRLTPRLGWDDRDTDMGRGRFASQRGRC